MQGRAGYGYQWWATRGQTYRAVRIFGQVIWIAPELKLMLVTQSAWPGATDTPSPQARQGPIDAITVHFR